MSSLKEIRFLQEKALKSDKGWITTALLWVFLFPAVFFFAAKHGAGALPLSLLMTVYGIGILLIGILMKYLPRRFYKAYKATIAKEAAAGLFDEFTYLPKTGFDPEVLKETGLMNLYTDALCVLSESDISMHNGGGIREGLMKGDILMMKLVLVRHGESEWNKLNLFTGWTDVDLSEKGHEEAKNAGRLLKEEGYDFDVCYTSYLKRAIHTLYHILDEMDRAWLPVNKSWKLNERHYGALQGLNKSETAEKYGEEQVKIWRRSFNVKPPALEADDERSALKQPMYRDVDKALLPANESLETTIERVVPYFNEVIRPDMQAGKRVIIAAHGNSLRALVKYFDRISDEEIVGVNIPTGTPLVYEFDDDFRVIRSYYLGDQEALKARMEAVANQGKKQK